MEISLLPALVPVSDHTRVAETRRRAISAAEAEGLPAKATEELAIIATEVSTNLLKHAQSGEVIVSRLSGYGEAGVEILSIDRGPGIANVDACLSDGYSTAGTPGSGLGAISRLADVFDLYSQPGRGTVLAARKLLTGKSSEAKPGWRFASIRVAYPGEQTCGDNWTIYRNGATTSLILADGLGHGVAAADASTAAVVEFKRRPEGRPAATLENVHLALRATRGAAVAVASIEHSSGRVRYAGVGNIAGVLLGGTRQQFMVSHNGTAGLEARRFQEFEYGMPAGGAIVLHSDGLTSNWTLDSYPGLLGRHPALISGILYRDAKRRHDDVCIVVGKNFQG